MKKETLKVTPEQMVELATLEAVPEAEINTRDIPEQKDWTGARRGAFYCPIKK